MKNVYSTGVDLLAQMALASDIIVKMSSLIIPRGGILGFMKGLGALF